MLLWHTYLCTLREVISPVSVAHISMHNIRSYHPRTYFDVHIVEPITLHVYTWNTLMIASQGHIPRTHHEGITLSILLTRISMYSFLHYRACMIITCVTQHTYIHTYIHSYLHQHHLYAFMHFAYHPCLIFSKGSLCPVGISDVVIQ